MYETDNTIIELASLLQNKKSIIDSLLKSSNPFTGFDNLEIMLKIDNINNDIILLRYNKLYKLDSIDIRHLLYEYINSYENSSYDISICEFL